MLLNIDEYFKITITEIFYNFNKKLIKQTFYIIFELAKNCYNCNKNYRSTLCCK